MLAGFASCFAGTQTAGAEFTPDWKLINLDIDHSVKLQREVCRLIDEQRDLHASINAIRLWTNARGLRIVRETISELRLKYPHDRWFTFMGSGDFHQLSATLIESLPDSKRPVTIILLDNHPDWFKAPAHYHCGAWVVQALKHKWVEQVIMIAQNSNDIRGDQFKLSPFNELCKGRVVMYPLKRERVFVPLAWPKNVAGVASFKRTLLGTELRFDSLQKLGANKLSERLAESLAGKNVYISIDKDVLNKEEAISDWDQGELKLDDMLTIIKGIAKSANIIGVDVCGERAPEPVHGLLKKIDSGRTFKNKIRKFEEANRINEQSNLKILHAITNSAAVITQGRIQPAKDNKTTKQFGEKKHLQSTCIQKKLLCNRRQAQERQKAISESIRQNSFVQQIKRELPANSQA